MGRSDGSGNGDDGAASVVSVADHDLRKYSIERAASVLWAQGSAGHARNFVRQKDGADQRGRNQKARDNIQAIRLIKECARANRFPTEEEREKIALFYGFGGIPQAFPRPDGSIAKGWDSIVRELELVTTPEEYAAIRRSIIDAQYTSDEVVELLWAGVLRMGLADAISQTDHTFNILEPSMGSGVFFALMPDELQANAVVDRRGIEMDPISATVAKVLFPEDKITQSPFQRVHLRRPVDLVIGNPPFGGQKLLDMRRPDLTRVAPNTHGFFFAKSLDALNPGGMAVMVVSYYLLDADRPENRAFRQWMHRHAELLHAVRLPFTALAKTAFTHVVADLIVLRKRPEVLPVDTPDPVWIDGQVPLRATYEGQTIHANGWFAAHEDLILGTPSLTGAMYGLVGRFTVEPFANSSLEVLLNERFVQRLPQDGWGQWQPQEVVLEAAPLPEVDRESVGRVQPYGYFVVPESANAVLVEQYGVTLSGLQIGRRLPDDEDGRFVYDLLNEANGKHFLRLAGMIALRDMAQELLEGQMSDGRSDAELARLRARLNQHYDDFRKRFGCLNAPANARLLRGDPGSAVVMGLERDYDKGVSRDLAQKTGEAPRKPSAEKSDLFKKRTQFPIRPVEQADNAKDALFVSLAETGSIQWPRILRLTGKDWESIAADLDLETPHALAFETEEGAWEERSAFLSGDILSKIEAIEKALRDQSVPEGRQRSLRASVDALRGIKPKAIPAEMVTVHPGAPYLDVESVLAFLHSVGIENNESVQYLEYTGQWLIRGVSSGAAAQAFETSVRPLNKLVEDLFNHRSPIIYIYHEDGTKSVDQEGTALAIEKVKALREHWNSWILSDPERLQRIADLYNERFNRRIEREFDGRHLTLPGSSATISLRPHQKNAVWRACQNKSVLFDHKVGAGKTFAAIAAVMEKRRMGQARKPIVTVPNHLVGQWASAWMTLYPSARILVADEQDMDSQHRQIFLAQAAYNDWDAVILSHSAFKMIPVDPEFYEGYLEREMGQIDALLAAMPDIDKMTLKQMEKMRQSLRMRIERMHAKVNGKRDQGMLTFGEIGFDYVVNDESHTHKNVPYMTMLKGVSGLGNPEGSERAEDMLIKVTQARESGAGVLFLTGTPISNTIAEMYLLMRYLAPEILDQQRLYSFDGWVSTFATVNEEFAFTLTGQFKSKKILSEFNDIPTLVAQYKSFADIIGQQDIDRLLKAEGQKAIPLPKIRGGKPQIVTCEMSPVQRAIVGEEVGVNELGEPEYAEGSILYRLDHLPSRPGPGKDNMLVIINDLKKVSLDARAFDPDAPASETGKIATSVEQIREVYERWNADRGAQLVFLDFSTPKGKKGTVSAETREILDLVAKVEAGEEEEASDAQRAAAELAEEKLAQYDPTEVQEAQRAARGQQVWSAYEDIRDRLIASGIPESEIAFIHDANTDLRKEELFSRVRAGAVRVLLGSTGKMGPGMNVQDRLVAIHHIDVPYRPSDVEQRNGRMLRQGNKLLEKYGHLDVDIFYYVTENSSDAGLWQILETKDQFINSIRFASGSRTVADPDAQALDPAAVKAMASGHELLMVEVPLRARLRNLERLEKAYKNERWIRDSNLERTEKNIAEYEEQFPRWTQDAEAARTLEAQWTAQREALSGKEKMQYQFRGAAREPVEINEIARVSVESLFGYQAGGSVDLGNFEGFDVAIRRDRNDREKVSIDVFGPSKAAYEGQTFIPLQNTDYTQRFRNIIRGIANFLDARSQKHAEDLQNVRAMKAESGNEFPRYEEMAVVREQHQIAETLMRLRVRKWDSIAHTLETLSTTPEAVVKATDVTGLERTENGQIADMAAFKALQKQAHEKLRAEAREKAQEYIDRARIAFARPPLLPHNVEILLKLGVTEQEIDALKAEHGYQETVEIEAVEDVEIDMPEAPQNRIVDAGDDPEVDLVAASLQEGPETALEATPPMGAAVPGPATAVMAQKAPETASEWEGALAADPVFTSMPVRPARAEQPLPIGMTMDLFGNLPDNLQPSAAVDMAPRTAGTMDSTQSSGPLAQDAVPVRRLQSVPKSLLPFLGGPQKGATETGLRGPDGDFFDAKMRSLQTLIETMPRSYETEGQGDQAIVHLHYFGASSDWYLTELDSDPDHVGQRQAFGVADLGMGYPEMGYIDLQEALRLGAELDYHFEPVSLRALKQKLGMRVRDADPAPITAPETAPEAIMTEASAPVMVVPESVAAIVSTDQRAMWESLWMEGDNSDREVLQMHLRRLEQWLRAPLPVTEAEKQRLDGRAGLVLRSETQSLHWFITGLNADRSTAYGLRIQGDDQATAGRVDPRVALQEAPILVIGHEPGPLRADLRDAVILIESVEYKDDSRAIFWRGGQDGTLPRVQRIEDILDYERNTLENADVRVNTKAMEYLRLPPVRTLQWVTTTEDAAREYGDPQMVVFTDPVVLARDDHGGVLVAEHGMLEVAAKSALQSPPKRLAKKAGLSELAQEGPTYQSAVEAIENAGGWDAVADSPALQKSLQDQLDHLIQTRAEQVSQVLQEDGWKWSGAAFSRDDEGFKIFPNGRSSGGNMVHWGYRITRRDGDTPVAIDVDDEMTLTAQDLVGSMLDQMQSPVAHTSAIPTEANPSTPDGEISPEIQNHLNILRPFIPENQFHAILGVLSGESGLEAAQSEASHIARLAQWIDHQGITYPDGRSGNGGHPLPDDAAVQGTSATCVLAYQNVSGTRKTYLTGMDDLGNLYGIRARINVIAGPVNLASLLKQGDTLNLTMQPLPVAELLKKNGYDPEAVTHEPAVTVIHEPYRNAIAGTISGDRVQFVLNLAVPAMQEDWTGSVRKIQTVERALQNAIPDENLRMMTLENLKTAASAVEANRHAEAVHADLADPEEAPAPEAPAIAATPLQQAMLLKIARSEYTPVDGEVPQNAGETETWADMVIETADDKGVFTSLKNAELVWHSGEKKDAGVGLTEKGFALYQAIEAARSQAVETPKAEETPKVAEPSEPDADLPSARLPSARLPSTGLPSAGLPAARPFGLGDPIARAMLERIEASPYTLSYLLGDDRARDVDDPPYAEDAEWLAARVQFADEIDAVLNGRIRQNVDALGEHGWTQPVLHGDLTRGGAVIHLDTVQDAGDNMQELIYRVSLTADTEGNETRTVRDYLRISSAQFANELHGIAEQIKKNPEQHISAASMADENMPQTSPEQEYLNREQSLFHDLVRAAQNFATHVDAVLTHATHATTVASMAQSLPATESGWSAENNLLWNQHEDAGLPDMWSEKTAEQLTTKEVMADVRERFRQSEFGREFTDIIQSTRNVLRMAEYLITPNIQTRDRLDRQAGDAGLVNDILRHSAAHDVTPENLRIRLQTLMPDARFWSLVQMEASLQRTLDGYVVAHIREHAPMVAQQAKANALEHFLLGNVLSATSNAILDAIEDETLPQAVRNAAKAVLQGREGMTDYRARIGRMVFDAERAQPAARGEVETPPAGLQGAPMENGGDRAQSVRITLDHGAEPGWADMPALDLRGLHEDYRLHSESLGMQTQVSVLRQTAHGPVPVLQIRLDDSRHLTYHGDFTVEGDKRLLLAVLTLFSTDPDAALQAAGVDVRGVHLPNAETMAAYLDAWYAARQQAGQVEPSLARYHRAQKSTVAQMLDQLPTIYGTARVQTRILIENFHIIEGESPTVLSDRLQREIQAIERPIQGAKQAIVAAGLPESAAEFKAVLNGPVPDAYRHAMDALADQKEVALRVLRRDPALDAGLLAMFGWLDSGQFKQVLDAGSWAAMQTEAFKETHADLLDSIIDLRASQMANKLGAAGWKWDRASFTHPERPGAKIFPNGFSNGQGNLVSWGYVYTDATVPGGRLEIVDDFRSDATDFVKALVDRHDIPAIPVKADSLSEGISREEVHQQGAAVPEGMSMQEEAEDFQELDEDSLSEDISEEEDAESVATAEDARSKVPVPAMERPRLLMPDLFSALENIHLPRSFANLSGVFPATAIFQWGRDRTTAKVDITRTQMDEFVFGLNLSYPLGGMSYGASDQGTAHATLGDALHAGREALVDHAMKTLDSYRYEPATARELQYLVGSIAQHPEGERRILTDPEEEIQVNGRDAVLALLNLQKAEPDTAIRMTWGAWREKPRYTLDLLQREAGALPQAVLRTAEGQIIADTRVDPLDLDAWQAFLQEATEHLADDHKRMLRNHPVGMNSKPVLHIQKPLRAPLPETPSLPRWPEENAGDLPVETGPFPLGNMDRYAVRRWTDAGGGSIEFAIGHGPNGYVSALGMQLGDTAMATRPNVRSGGREHETPIRETFAQAYADLLRQWKKTYAQDQSIGLMRGHDALYQAVQDELDGKLSSIVSERTGVDLALLAHRDLEAVDSLNVHPGVQVETRTSDPVVSEINAWVLEGVRTDGEALYLGTFGTWERTAQAIRSAMTRLSPALTEDLDSRITMARIIPTRAGVLAVPNDPEQPAYLAGVGAISRETGEPLRKVTPADSADVEPVLPEIVIEHPGGAEVLVADAPDALASEMGQTAVTGVFQGFNADFSMIRIGNAWWQHPLVDDWLASRMMSESGWESAADTIQRVSQQLGQEIRITAGVSDAEPLYGQPFVQVDLGQARARHYESRLRALQAARRTLWRDAGGFRQPGMRVSAVMRESPLLQVRIPYPSPAQGALHLEIQYSGQDSIARKWDVSWRDARGRRVMDVFVENHASVTPEAWWADNRARLAEWAQQAEAILTAVSRLETTYRESAEGLERGLRAVPLATVEDQASLAEYRKSVRAVYDAFDQPIRAQRRQLEKLGCPAYSDRMRDLDAGDAVRAWRMAENIQSTILKEAEQQARYATQQRGIRMLELLPENGAPEDMAAAVFLKHGIEFRQIPPMVTAVQNRDVERVQSLIGHNSQNPASQEVFERMTGLRLGETQKVRMAQIDEWAGITPEDRAQIEAQQQAAQEREKHRADAQQAWEALAHVEARDAEDRSVRSGQDILLQQVEKGYTVAVLRNDPDSLGRARYHPVLARPGETDGRVLRNGSEFKKLMTALVKGNFDPEHRFVESLEAIGLLNGADAQAVAPEAAAAASEHPESAPAPLAHAGNMVDRLKDIGFTDRMIYGGDGERWSVRCVIPQAVYGHEGEIRIAGTRDQIGRIELGDIPASSPEVIYPLLKQLESVGLVRYVDRAQIVTSRADDGFVASSSSRILNAEDLERIRALQGHKALEVLMTVSLDAEGAPSPAAAQAARSLIDDWKRQYGIPIAVTVLADMEGDDADDIELDRDGVKRQLQVLGMDALTLALQNGELRRFPVADAQKESDLVMVVGTPLRHMAVAAVVDRRFTGERKDLNKATYVVDGSGQIELHRDALLEIARRRAQYKAMDNARLDRRVEVLPEVADPAALPPTVIPPEPVAVPGQAAMRTAQEATSPEPMPFTDLSMEDATPAAIPDAATPETVARTAQPEVVQIEAESTVSEALPDPEPLDAQPEPMTEGREAEEYPSAPIAVLPDREEDAAYAVRQQTLMDGLQTLDWPRIFGSMRELEKNSGEVWDAAQCCTVLRAHLKEIQPEIWAEAVHFHFDTTQNPVKSPTITERGEHDMLAFMDRAIVDVWAGLHKPEKPFFFDFEDARQLDQISKLYGDTDRWIVVDMQVENLRGIALPEATVAVTEREILMALDRMQNAPQWPQISSEDAERWLKRAVEVADYEHRALQQMLHQGWIPVPKDHAEATLQRERLLFLVTHALYPSGSQMGDLLSNYGKTAMLQRMLLKEPPLSPSADMLRGTLHEAAILNEVDRRHPGWTRITTDYSVELDRLLPEVMVHWDALYQDTDGAYHLVDAKSPRSLPDAVEDDYVAQLNLYGEGLRRILAQQGTDAPKIHLHLAYGVLADSRVKMVEIPHDPEMARNLIAAATEVCHQATTGQISERSTAVMPLEQQAELESYLERYERHKIEADVIALQLAELQERLVHLQDGYAPVTLKSQEEEPLVAMRFTAPLLHKGDAEALSVVAAAVGVDLSTYVQPVYDTVALVDAVRSAGLDPRNFQMGDQVDGQTLKTAIRAAGGVPESQWTWKVELKQTNAARAHRELLKQQMQDERMDAVVTSRPVRMDAPVLPSEPVDTDAPALAETTAVAPSSPFGADPQRLAETTPATPRQQPHRNKP